MNPVKNAYILKVISVLALVNGASLDIDEAAESVFSLTVVCEW
ncbi:MAG: hypothetical protein ACI38Q_06030 [Candidatus Bruticola sp.]